MSSNPSPNDENSIECELSLEASYRFEYQFSCSHQKRSIFFLKRKSFKMWQYQRRIQVLNPFYLMEIAIINFFWCSSKKKNVCSAPKSSTPKLKEKKSAATVPMIDFRLVFSQFLFFFSFYLVLLFNFSVDTSLQSVYFHLIDWLIEECRADFVESSPSVYFYLIYWIFIGGCLVVAWNLLKCLPGQQSLELSNSVVTYFFNSEWISLSLV